MKIFYNPDTLKIMGMSEEISMDFPYLETDENYHTTDNLSIVERDEELVLEITESTLEESNIPERITTQSRKREDAEILKQKIKEGNLDLRDLTQYVIKYI